MKRRSLLAGAGVLAAAPLIDLQTAQASPSHGKVMTGAMALAADDWRALAGQKVGVISNPTGILPDLNHIVDTMHASGKVNVVAVFGPEHGFRGSAQAGGSEGDHVDPRTGIMVYDAYGANADEAGRPLHQVRRRDRRLRHPGRRCAVLHLHLDDVRGDAGRGPHRRALRRTRPSEPGRRVRARPDAEARLHLRASARRRSSSSTA